MQIKKIAILFLFVVSVLQLNAQGVGLVLSGGGAKGLSHVGAIKALEENNIPIDYITGTSMGAIVGALYSIGLTPDEMITLFKSKQFESWYNGEQEPLFATYMYRRDATPEMFKVTANLSGEKKFSLNLPSSIVAPYPMDLAVMQLFASPAAAAGYDFDKLMVPYRCVASDVARKAPVSFRKGDLGSAVRASMTFPLFFQPIVIDSVLYFDGGLYNNFPWDIMIKDFKPDYMIGVKCASQFATVPKPDDIVSQIETMLMVETNYNIPEEKGILLDMRFANVSLLDFDKIDQLVQTGYFNMMKLMPEIKKNVRQRRSDEELLEKRLAFRTRCTPLNFEKVIIRDSLRFSSKDFIDKTFRENRTRYFDFEQLKRGYYRVIASGNVKNFYPVAKLGKDSVYNVDLQVSEAPPLKIAIGGNISSSSLNQGYLGLEYRKFSSMPWKAAADINLGRFYTGFSGYFRQDLSIRPFAFYELQLVTHRFDYFGGTQTNFFSNRVPTSNVQEGEVFATASIATPINLYENLLAKLTLTVGKNVYEYYQTDRFTSYDIPDETNLSYFSPSFYIEKNTTNNRIYPTEGSTYRMSLRFTHLKEDYQPGSTSLDALPISKKVHNSISFRNYFESYTAITKQFTLGWIADVTISNRTAMGDRISTLLYLPAFQPTPHSKTLLLSSNRSQSFVGLAVMPIFRFTKSLSVHVMGAYFQPYKLLEKTNDGSTLFSPIFPSGNFSAEIAGVWQSPVGPVTLSASYYDKSDVKWFPQLNIGFLIFKPKALAY